ncbi:MAG: hypothetical protein WC483_01040 [Candidatus Paceibacterota bacterium]
MPATKMTWPIWFVIGLTIIAALSTVVYAIWLNQVAGYVRTNVDDGRIVPLVMASTEENGPIAILVVYRSPDPLLHRQLQEKMKERLCHFAADAIPLHTTKEPGYNVFRSFHKNKDQLIHAYSEWRHSFFHACMMPIELILRATVFPLWTMLDLVSHEGRVAAALVFHPDVNEETRRIIEKRVSVVETYNDIYFKTEDTCAIRFTPLSA